MSSSLRPADNRQLTAFRQQFRACCAVNRAIHTAAAEQCRVRGIHNRVNRERCDVAAEEFDSPTNA
jgi:hypothetical protein